MTRTIQKSHKTSSASYNNWRKYLRYAKVPYKVHTDRQSAFGPQPQDYKDGAKKQATVSTSTAQESMLVHTVGAQIY